MRTDGQEIWEAIQQDIAEEEFASGVAEYLRRMTLDGEVWFEREHLKDWVPAMVPATDNKIRFFRTPGWSWRPQIDEWERRALQIQNCPCNPARGGSGVCGCILGSPVIW